MLTAMITTTSRKQFVRPRRRRVRQPVQLELSIKRDKNGQRRGGARPGAGRKPKHGRAGSPHKRRAEVNRRHPQHVVLRVLGSVGWLRRMDMYQAIRIGLCTALARDDFRIVHYSVQGHHIHLLCEADDKHALAAGVKGFEVSAARHINAVLSRRRGRARKGQVFADRYHVESMSSVRQTRHAICYVLNNWRHHDRHRTEPGIFNGRLDPYSSAMAFPGWREREHRHLHVPPDVPFPIVSRPQTWLLAEAWKRDRPISVYEIPGPSHQPPTRQPLRSHS